MTEKKRTIIVAFTLLILLPIIFIAGLMFGSEKIPLKDVFQSVFFSSSNNAMLNFTKIILLDIRLPRTLLALLCGGLLAASGAIFQGFFRSSLAESSMLGVSSGAALGAIIGSLFSLWIPSTAFIGAIASIFLVYLIAGNKRTSAEPIRLLLAGSAISVFFTSISSAILLVKDKELYKMYVWTLGSFNGKGWTELQFILFPAILSFILCLLCIKPLDIMSSGDISAQSLGVNISKTRFLCFTAGSLGAAAAVCAGGIIGFIGLIAPHIIRMICGSSHKRVLPLSILAGSCILGFVDILCRIIVPPLDIPVGIITAIMGAPFFIAILIRYNKRYTI